MDHALLMRRLQVVGQGQPILLGETESLGVQASLVHNVSKDVRVRAGPDDYCNNRDAFRDLTYRNCLAMGGLLHKFVDRRKDLVIAKQLLTTTRPILRCIEGRAGLMHGLRLRHLTAICTKDHAFDDMS